jgi:hypothetical protein
MSQSDTTPSNRVYLAALMCVLHSRGVISDQDANTLDSVVKLINSLVGRGIISSDDMAQQVPVIQELVRVVDGAVRSPLSVRRKACNSIVARFGRQYGNLIKQLMKL